MNLSQSGLELVGRLQERMLANISTTAKEWSGCIRDLNRWEDQHLLSSESPPPEKLEEHKKMVERLLFFGQIFAFSTSHPELADAETAGMVFATQQVLRDKLQMFHNPMSEEDADKLLQEVFPES
jgi:hypothetical protein